MVSSSQACTNPTEYLSRPLRLCKRNPADAWKLEEWNNAFSDSVGVGTDIAEKIVKFSRERSMQLCAKHYGVMRRLMDRIGDPAQRCSVCNSDGKVGVTNTLTALSFSKLKGRNEIICVIEDALVSFKEKQLQPQDLEYLCSSCRLVVLRRVSLRDLGIRDIQLRAGDFDYGPTPLAIGGCIKFVEQKLLIERETVVHLKDAMKDYLRLIKDEESETEK